MYDQSTHLICTYIHTYIHTYIRIYVYIHTNAYMYDQSTHLKHDRLPLDGAWGLKEDRASLNPKP